MVLSLRSIKATSTVCSHQLTIGFAQCGAINCLGDLMEHELPVEMHFRDKCKTSRVAGNLDDITYLLCCSNMISFSNL